ncbi:MAG: hypothetical protein COW00_03050 [Bdellovibrio sp. CG12_big_fil_rev_8_21_14_0_65_39_13]|nr:MAG: hypothetical protein COW78_19180 [Bdellovibrio sp. CG22_combo_CG10-13_8_21_14_all_39_27]PIQ61669.1 MAG: hypothetical protein COW00_03050 [Bdellovibrio sp. CG12_big_fil_rev_8_21_14_0_65_39_13]PIR35613.1 MAG: hypothetical protein COV37_07440 [Bdellovibrio sp. CG11_big_fil_rev_8_21_14_0_20_39_38]PJB52529.1 MAG: hypothetical protein CO099_12105 [Bdellovibrio sp. CG_4_9_14_3_um_filter_39_7]
MKRLLLAFLILGNLSVLHAAEAPVGETVCDQNDEKCCEQVAAGKRQVDGVETVVAPDPSKGAPSDNK